MRFLSDNRAQSIQVGAVLLFGVLIILLSTWQAFVIPDQNEGIEFNHNQEVQQQMTELRSTVLSMPSTDTPGSVTVNLGLQYPSRTIFRNPPPVSGRIQTTETTESRFNVTFTNADPSNDDLAQLWAQNGSSYNTGSIEYRPSYNQYGNAPRTFYANSVLFNKFDREQQQLPITGQSLVRGDRISLVTINGSLSENRIGSVSVDFEPVSTQTRTVEIKPDNGPIQIELPTRLNESRWVDLFSTEQNVESVSVDRSAFDDEELGLLNVTLSDDPDAYQLRLSKVGVGTGVTETTSAYVTDIAGNDSVIQSGETETLTVEARDRFNKPLSGVNVSASAEGGAFAGGSTTTTKTTDNEGQATLQYTGSTVGENNINVTIEDGYQPVSGETHDTTKPTNLTMVVTVEKQSTGGDNQLPGPKPINLTLEDNTVVQGGALDITNASFDNQGTTAQPRGGTNVTGGEYYVVEGNVTDPNDGGAVVRGSLTEGDALALTPLTGPRLTLTTEGTIDTTNLNTGDYTVFVRGQDTRGIWTDESVDGYTGKLFEVTTAPEFESIEVTSSGPGNGNNNDQLTFSYTTTDSTSSVTLFAETSPGGTELVNDPNAPTDSQNGETYTFDNNVNMNNQNINIEMTSFNGDGDSQTCTGTITTKGGSISLGDMNCTFN